jgi:hypothetical protein
MYARDGSIWLAVWIQPVARTPKGSEGIQLSGIHLEAVPQMIEFPAGRAWSVRYYY